LSDTARLDPALVDAIGTARHVCVLTGAGISAESGVPTFRDAQQGLWARYDPHELATPEAFARDPDLVWRWYRWRRDLVARAEPNAGHRALASLAGKTSRLTLVTQNVDGLHRRAGSEEVIEFHGNIFVNRCFRDGHTVDVEDTETVPACPRCGGPVRPGVVWFGEAIPEDALSISFAAAADCDVFLSIGTSSLVQPAAGLAMIARDAGAATIEINPEPTDIAGSFGAVWQGNAGEILPKLIESLTH
jgi:NAD-dependent deacetylase